MNWSEIFKKRYEIHRRWPQIWDLPIQHKRFQAVTSQLKNGAKVLDLGADRREWEPRLKAHDSSLSYFSCDINKSQPHDWYDLDEIQETFDAILFFEVIEHIPREIGIEMLEKIFKLLNPKGKLILTSPNIWHPPQYLRDVTHVQPWAYDELGGALLSCGFEVIEMYRLWNSTFLDRFTRLCFGQWLHRYVGVDFSKTLMVIAGRP